jgi:fructose-1,6-bisphosphatase
LRKSLANLEATSQTEMSKIATQLQKSTDLQLVLQSDTQQLKDITDEIRQKELEDDAIKKAKKDIKEQEEGKRDEGAPDPLTPAEIERQAIITVLDAEEGTIRALPEDEFDKTFSKMPYRKAGKMSFESQIKQVFATLMSKTLNQTMKKSLITKYNDAFPISPVVGTQAEQKYIESQNKVSARNIALVEARERYLSKL